MVKKKWKARDKAKFLERLSVLLSNGYNLSIGIELLLLSMNEIEKDKLIGVIEELKGGRPVYEAFERIELPSDILSYIYFSDHYGNLTQGLKEASDLYLKREFMKEKLFKLLRYPLFLLWILIVLSVVMIQFLFPHFKEMFDSLTLELPLLTRLFLYIVDFIPLVLFAVVILSLFVFSLYWLRYKKLTPHKKLSFLLKFPFLTPYVQKIVTYFFAIQLSGLLKGGMSIYQALQVFENQDKLLYFRDEAQQFIKQMQQGHSLVEIVRNRSCFLPEFSLIIGHGMQQGELDKELYMYSEILYKQLEEGMKRAMMVIQPTLFFIVGILVLLMFSAVLLPMFELINSLE